MCKKLILISILAVLATACFPKERELKSALGFHFGTASGNGYSYRRFFDKDGIQIVFGAVTTGQNDVSFDNKRYFYDGRPTETYTKKGRRTSASFGLSYIHILTASNNTKFYVTAGGSYLVSRRTEFSQLYERENDSYSSYIKAGEPVRHNKENDRWTLGIGPGMELISDRNIRLSLEIPITINSKDEVIPYIPQIGIYYYF